MGRALLIETIGRIIRRGITVAGAGAVVAGGDVATTAGVLAILVEFGYETWRTRRKAKREQAKNR